jgi:hypothetical protein
MSDLHGDQSSRIGALLGVERIGSHFERSFDCIDTEIKAYLSGQQAPPFWAGDAWPRALLHALMLGSA